MPIQPCPRCAAPTLHDTLDGDRLRLDPTPLTPQLEAACLILARPTYEARITFTGEIRITKIRTGYGKTFFPNQLRENDIVLPIHECGKQLADILEPPQTKTGIDPDGPPPF